MAQPTPPTQRSPILAGLLSLLFPGLGHLYLRRVGPAFGFLIPAVTMVLLLIWLATTTEVEMAPGMLGVLIAITAAFWLAAVVTAVLVAGGNTPPARIAIILVLAFIYIVGWQATRVNLTKFFTEFDDVFPIFTRVMWPWQAAVIRNDDIAIVDTPFANPCLEGEIPEQFRGDDSAPWIVIEPGCGEFTEFILGTGTIPGDVLTISGGGFIPNREVEIWWEDPLGVEFQPIDEGERLITTADANGEISLTFTAPQYRTPGQAVGVQLHHAQARQLVAEGTYELSPDFRLAIDRMVVTIFQALMATSIGIIFAIPLSFFAARNLMSGSRLTISIYYALRFVMNVARSIEPIIWAVIATVWVGLGPFAGVIALTVHTVAALGKLYSEAIESIEPGPIEAITATGANPLQTIVYAIIPQIIPPFLSFTLYRWDINVRMSTIIGFVGGGGIGQILFQWINQSRWSAAGMAVWLIAITVSLMDYASAELRKRYV